MSGNDAQCGSPPSIADKHLVHEALNSEPALFRDE